MFVDERLTRRVLTTAGEAPRCQTTSSLRPFTDDGAPQGWTDPSGTPRWACVHHPLAAPAGASPDTPPDTSVGALPLVVFLHGAFGSATALYDHTSLVGRAGSYDLTGDPARPGYVVAALQARDLHWPNGRADGAHFDPYYRTLGRNPDVIALDHLIDAQVSAGGIDPQRIYLLGWSNGALFAQFYAIARHGTPTPGGHRVAAVAVYAAGDPYENVSDGQSPSCAASPYPRSSVPVYVLQRACDAATACDPLQRGDFGAPPGYDVETWVRRLQTDVGDESVRLQLVDGRGAAVNACAHDCTLPEGLRNHLRWPDGVADFGGHDWEPAMLDFLREHPLVP